MSNNSYENENCSHDRLTTAYELTKQIKQDMDRLGLEDAYSSVTIDLEVVDGETDIEYIIEATGVYNELDIDPETTYFENSDRIEPVDSTLPADEDVITQTLEEHIDSALKVNGKVVRELFSPDYDAF